MNGSGDTNPTPDAPRGDHPHTDPGDGRTECDMCGKWIHECIHSCKHVPVTDVAWERFNGRQFIAKLKGES